MYQLERPPHLVYAGVDEVQSANIRTLIDYWRSKCRGDTPPPRSAIEPSDIRPLLPYLVLAELSQAPLEIVYRLVGTAVAKAHRDDFTGRSHDTVGSLAGSGIEDAYRRVLENGAPSCGRTGLDAGDGSWIGFEYAILPLSDDGRAINKCLAIECPGEPERSA
ncbi:MAG TPA: PAS domain-containing protein [Candidatus Cybelea sp.]|nr:PAS domain-containing protein [Candidatus Cybelea sp.]